MITLERVKELIVDADHRFIAALEAHLGIHPNRAPAAQSAAPAPAAIDTSAATKTHIAGLEAKLDELGATVTNLQKVADDRDAALDAAEADVANLKAQLDTQAAAYTELDAQTKTLTESLAAAQEQIRTLTAAAENSLRGDEPEAKDGKA